MAGRGGVPAAATVGRGVRAKAAGLAEGPRCFGPEKLEVLHPDEDGRMKGLGGGGAGLETVMGVAAGALLAAETAGAGRNDPGRKPPPRAGVAGAEGG